MTAVIGLIGLGTMGKALALNIAEKGFDIAVYNRTAGVTERFAAEAGALAARITPCVSLEELVAAIAVPRAIILMVPAGPAVDQMIAALRPLLGPDDLIIDAGNADFHDTMRRARRPRRRACPISASACRAARRARGTAPRSWAAGRRRPGTGSRRS